ncbi:hypothetical protein DIPPA_51861 [Diplonema papillatum]|nr:hypothetical protein DIPPA_51861 [Diplonema papillatum]
MAAFNEGVALQCLINASTSQEQQKLKQAEQVLTQQMHARGYTPFLVNVLLCESVPLPARQMAGLELKRAVKEFWSHDTQEIPAEDKAAVRQELPKAFFLRSTLLTTIAGVSLGEIAKVDFPEAWPSLVQELTGVLKSHLGNPPVLAATVKCLKIMSEELTPDSVAHFATNAVPDICLVIADGGIAFCVRRNALSTIDGMVQASTLVSTKASEMPPTLRSCLPPLSDGCIRLFSDHSQPSLGIAALKFFNIVLAVYPSTIQTCLPQLATAICNSLAALTAKLVSNFNGTGTDETEGYTSEGDLFDTATLTHGHLEVLLNFFKSKKGRKALTDTLGLRNDGEIKKLLAMLITCVWYLDEDLNACTDDPGTYIQNETLFEEAGVPCWNLRETSCSVIEELQGLAKCHGALLAVCTENLQGYLSGVQNWKSAEATLLVLETLFLNSRELGKAGFQPAQLFDVVLKILQKSLQHNEVFLSGRVFWLVSKTIYTFRKKLDGPNQVPAALLQVCTQCVCSESSSHILRAQAVKCFLPLYQTFPSEAPRTVCEQAAESVVESVRKLLVASTTIGDMGPSKRVTGDLLNSYIEDLTLIIRSHISLNESTLPQDAILLWKKHQNDPFTVEAVTDLFGILAGVPSAEGSLHIVVPLICGVLQEDESRMPPGMISSAVTILCHIGRKASPSLLERLVQMSFPAMAMLTRKQTATSSIAMCLRTILRRSGSMLNTVMVQDPFSSSQTAALSVALEIIRHTLEPTNSEHSLSQTGKLIFQVLGSAGDQLSVAQLAALLDMVLCRAATAQTATIVQEMLLPIAALACQRPEDMAFFLLQAPTKRFGPLLNAWLEHCESFWGASHEQLLLLAGLLSLAPRAQGFTVTAKQVEKKKHSKHQVPAELGVVVAVAKTFSTYLAAQSERDDSIIGDDESDEEDEEREEAAVDESEGSMDGEDSEDDEDFVISKDVVRSIIGDPNILTSVSQFLRTHHAHFMQVKTYLTDAQCKRIVNKIST